MTRKRIWTMSFLNNDFMDIRSRTEHGHSSLRDLSLVLQIHSPYVNGFLFKINCIYMYVKLLIFMYSPYSIFSLIRNNVNVQYMYRVLPMYTSMHIFRTFNTLKFKSITIHACTCKQTYIVAVIVQTFQQSNQSVGGYARLVFDFCNGFSIPVYIHNLCSLIFESTYS